MLNKVFLQGRMVADPELKQTTSGVSVTSFRIAVDRDFKNKETGEKETDFVTVVAWRNTADFVCKYFGKGRLVVVEGRLQTRNYTDKDDNKRTAVEVVADNVYFSDSKREDTHTDTDTDAYTAPASAPSQFEEIKDDDELPF